MLHRLLCSAALLTMTSAATAAPFASQYTGTISTSTHPDIVAGESYAVTVVMDNGGASTVNQTWTGADLVCVTFAFNDARNVVFAADVVATPPTSIAGSATTDGAGALSSWFTTIRQFTDQSPNFAASGFSSGPTPAVTWFLNSFNAVWYDTVFARAVNDAAGGVQMAAGNWSTPVAAAPGCVAAPPPPPPAPTGVPVMGPLGLVIMSLLLGGLGYRASHRGR